MVDAIQYKASAIVEGVEQAKEQVKEKMQERKEARVERRAAVGEALQQKKEAIHEAIQTKAGHVKAAFKHDPEPQVVPLASVGELCIKILSVSCQPKATWHLSLELCGQHRETQEQPNPELRPSLEGNLEFRLPVLDISSDLFLSLQRGPRLFPPQREASMGRACVPISSLLGLTAPRPVHQRELQLFPADRYHRDGGAAKFIPGVSMMPESGMSRPAAPLGAIRIELELRLATSLPGCYIAPRWVPTLAARATVEDQVFVDRGVSYGVKRSLDRFSQLPELTPWAPWYAGLGVLECGALLAAHGYACLVADPWQWPWIGFALFLRIEHAAYISPQRRTKPNGEPDGYLTPGAGHVTVWEDEIESPPKDERSFKERVTDRVDNNLVSKIRKLEKLVHDVPKVRVPVTRFRPN